MDGVRLICHTSLLNSVFLLQKKKTGFSLLHKVTRLYVNNIETLSPLLLMDEVTKRTAVGSAWIWTCVCHDFHCAICVITRCADTGLVPPASGVMVNAVELPAGFRTVSTELITVVCTRAMPTICEVPVARPTTV